MFVIKKNQAGGILIRAVEVVEGVELILKNLYKTTAKSKNLLLNGPGRVCKALQINMELNGIDMIDEDILYLVEGEKIKKSQIITTPRINIPYAKESKNWLWRFLLSNAGLK